MKLLKQCAAFAIAALLLVSCADETPWGSTTGRGKLNLRIEANGDVEAAVPAVRAISDDIAIPPVSAFTVSMIKEGGGYSKTWANVDEFAKEESFPVGNYTLSISYGDETSQGQVLSNEMGYEHAHFYGETTVAIKEGDETTVQLTAKLVNSVLIIEYTDAFKNYFPSYHTIVQPSGGKAIDLGDNEAKNFVQPGDLNITISATQQNGKELTLNPATFEVVGGHMYKMRYNVYNGEVGNAVLSIEFDESLEQDPVTVNLSDELNNTRAPQVTLIGPADGQTLAYAPGAPYTGDAKYTVVADGGIAKAVLTISSDDASFKPSFLSNGNDIDLCSATAAQKQALESYGIKSIGFSGNLDKMAELDLSGFFDYLPEGTCTFSFQVTDQYTQTNTPLSFSMMAIPIEKSAVCVEGAPFAENYVDVVVGYNGSEPTIDIPFTFDMVRASGMPSDKFEVLSVEATSAPAVRSDDYPVKYYKYRISLPEYDEILNKDSFEIRALYNGNSSDPIVVPVTVVYPNCNMTYDAMTSQLRWRVDFPDLEGKDNADALKTKYMNRLSVFVDGTAKTSTYDSDIYAYVISGLTAAQKYTVTTSMRIDKTAETSESVTMETVAGVPNGDFEDLTTTYDNVTIDQGGEYTRTLVSSAMQNTLTFTVREPSKWVSVNTKTCNLSASPCNTWFVLPSVYSTNLDWGSNRDTQGGMGGGTVTPEYYDQSNMPVQHGDYAVIVRNVAWSHSGTLPSKDKKTAIPSGYYSENQPSTIENRSAGKMFLGSSYSYLNGVETYNEGVTFESRPKALKGYYKYVNDSQDTNEKATVRIQLYSGSTELISKSIELSAKSDYTLFEIPLDCIYEFNVKVDQLRIMICSSNYAGTVAEESDAIKTTNYCNLYEQESRGAQLTVDNLYFEY